MKKRTAIKPVRYIFFVIALTAFSMGKLASIYNFMLFGVFVLFIHNLFYSFENINIRPYFLFFNITFFTFLIGRPVIDMFQKVQWWQEYSKASVVFSMNAIFFSLLSLFIGAVISDLFVKPNNPSPFSIKDIDENIHTGLLLISLAFFFLGIFSSYYIGFEKIKFIQNNVYEDYYKNFTTQANIIIKGFNYIMPYSLCLFLSLKPSKHFAFIPLSLYLLSAVPNLIVGARKDIVVNAIFVFAYYIIRDATDKDTLQLKSPNKWLGKFEKIAIIIALPFAFMFLTLYSAIRVGADVSLGNPIGYVSKFFYQQGISFHVLTAGHEQMIPNLSDKTFSFFSFGDIIDYFKFSNIGSTFFGVEKLIPGQNLDQLQRSHRLPPFTAYYIPGRDYLAGEGWGSVYILENYIDGGYIFMILFNIALGFLLVWMAKNFNRNIISTTIILLFTTEIFYTPRNTSSVWFKFLFLPEFYVLLFVCLFFGFLCKKTYGSSKFGKLEGDTNV